jgi:hypothetical protein
MPDNVPIGPTYEVGEDTRIDVMPTDGGVEVRLGRGADALTMTFTREGLGWLLVRAGEVLMLGDLAVEPEEGSERSGP